MRNRRQERLLWHAQYELASRLTSQGGVPSVHHLAASPSSRAAPRPAALPRRSCSTRRRCGARHFSEVFAYGNLLPAEAIELGRKWRAAIGAAPLALTKAPMPVGELLPAADEGGEAVRLTTTLVNADESNYGIELHLQVAAGRSRLASKDAFHELRTVRQLGYFAQRGVRGVARARGLSVPLLSAVRTPPQLEAEIEKWLVGFRRARLLLVVSYSASQSVV